MPLLSTYVPQVALHLVSIEVARHLQGGWPVHRRDDVWDIDDDLRDPLLPGYWMHFDLGAREVVLGCTGCGAVVARPLPGTLDATWRPSAVDDPGFRGDHYGDVVAFHVAHGECGRRRISATGATPRVTRTSPRSDRVARVYAWGEVWPMYADPAMGSRPLPAAGVDPRVAIKLLVPREPHLPSVVVVHEFQVS